MFGLRHRGCEPGEGHWAGGRRWRRHFGGGFGGRHGMGGGDMMRAGRMLATGRPAADRARADRRAAAPRLRDHQAARGQDRRLVLAEPRHRLSDPHLPGRGRLRHRAGRRREEALHHHRGRPRASRREPRLRRCGARAHERGRREGEAHPRTLRAAANMTTSIAAAGAAGTMRSTARFRRWCAPRSTICARSRRGRSKPTRMPRPGSSRCWRAPRRRSARISVRGSRPHSPKIRSSSSAIAPSIGLNSKRTRWRPGVTSTARNSTLAVRMSAGSPSTVAVHHGCQTSLSTT